MLKTIKDRFAKAAKNAGLSFYADFVSAVDHDNEARYPCLVLSPPTRTARERRGRDATYRCEFFILHKDEKPGGRPSTEAERFETWDLQEAIVDAIEAELIWTTPGEIFNASGGFALEPGYGMMQAKELHTRVTTSLKIKCHTE